MMPVLTNEVYWLVLTVLMTALLWIPYILNRMLEQGIGAALWDPYGHTETRKAWADRMMKAHGNAVENLVVFAPLVILIQMFSLNNDTTAMACMVYFFARLLHYICFTLAVPVLRIIMFATGFFMQLILAFTLLGL